MPSLSVIRAALALALVAALAIGAHLLLAAEVEKGVAQCQAKEAAAAASWNATYRAQDAAASAAVAKAVEHGNEVTQTVAAAAGRLGSALDGSVRRGIAAAPRCPVPGPAGAASDSLPADADVVSAELYRSLGEVAQRLAATADAARIAGDVCVQSAAPVTR